MVIPDLMLEIDCFIFLPLDTFYEVCIFSGGDSLFKGLSSDSFKLKRDDEVSLLKSYTFSFDFNVR